MGESDAKSRAAVVLGELFAELARRRRFKELIDRCLAVRSKDELVRRLADDLEGLVAATAPPELEEDFLQPKSPGPISIPPIELPVVDVVTTELSVPPPVPKVEVSIPVPPPAPPVRAPAPVITMPKKEIPSRPAVQEEHRVPSRHFVVAKQTFEVPEGGAFYCHGVAAIPREDQGSTKPFMLEEKGIDGQRLAFGWDFGGVRFYVSLMRDESAALGRGGVLLLPNQDAIRLRGIHESILNDLRLHGNVLPFTFGSVVKGWEETQKKLSGVVVRARPALEKLDKTRRWMLVVSGQDNRFADLQQNPTLEKRRELDRHRSSFTTSPAGGKHLDVRELERVLNKQRRIAEGIHRELSSVADKTEVQGIVSLQSGSSEGWKQILRATYEVSPTMITRFHRMVTDIQYEHLLLELMIALSGDVQSIALTEES